MKPEISDAWPDLRRSVFAPLAATVVLLFLALGLVALWNEKRSETEQITREVDDAVRLFGLQLAGDVDTMQLAMHPIISDPAILARFLARDREGLLQLTKAHFEVLDAHGISHMYFVGPDRVTFLRVHQPDNHGDLIDRFTMREAERTQALAGGLELGVLGVPTLRVVTPLWHEGRLVGYFEIGREVEHYAGAIHATLGIDLIVLIRKQLLTEHDWARGQALLGHEADWERFDEFVSAGPTSSAEVDRVLDEALPLLSRAPDEPHQLDLSDGRHVVIGARPLLDMSGRNLGLLVISLDATASVIDLRRTLFGFFAAFLAFTGVTVLLLYRIFNRAEQGLRRAQLVEHEAKAQLEQRVAERTAELEQQITEREHAEAQLRQAQKMEVIGQLTGGVAHDFNNLLAIIMSDLEVLRDRLVADGHDELLELIEGAWEATERGSSLIARLLAISRKQPLSPRRVDPNLLLQELMPLLQRAVPSSIVIQPEYGADLWACFVDPSQLENVILNLVVNGRDAMPQGGTLTIETCNRSVSPSEAREWGVRAGDYVQLAVADTGTGMPTDVMARAFDPFFTTKEVGKGSGLGLAMVHGTAKQSGGHVLLESSLGVGTTVTLLLPRLEVTQQSSAA